MVSAIGTYGALIKKSQLQTTLYTVSPFLWKTDFTASILV